MQSLLLDFDNTVDFCILITLLNKQEMALVEDNIVHDIHAEMSLPQYKKIDVYMCVSIQSPEKMNSLSQESERVWMLSCVPMHTIYNVNIGITIEAHAESRPAYHRMVDDCQHNNLDLIVGKNW